MTTERPIRIYGELFFVHLTRNYLFIYLFIKASDTSFIYSSREKKNHDDIYLCIFNRVIKFKKMTLSIFRNLVQNKKFSLHSISNTLT